MKSFLQGYLILAAISSAALQAHAQNPSYEVHAWRKRPVKQSTLSEARTMSDLLPGYPSSWISRYISSEISLMHKGRSETVRSQNDTLSAEQIKLLGKARPNAEIRIAIQYDHEVFVTHELEHNTLWSELSVVPETDAEFPGGSSQLQAYLRANGPQDLVKGSKPVHIRFTISKSGAIRNVKLLQSSGHGPTDQDFLRLIRQLPAWKPAKSTNGNFVEQLFEFSSGNQEGC